MIDDVSASKIADKEGNITSDYSSWIHRAFLILFAVQQSGTTAQRPTTQSQIWIGRQFYDTTLNKPVYVSAISGSTITWRDASGTIA